MRGACRGQLVQLQFLLQWRVESSRFAGKQGAGQHYYPADCARPARSQDERQLTLSPLCLCNTGGSVKVVSLIRFNCDHYYWNGSEVLTAHYDFKEVQININEARSMEMRREITSYEFYETF